ncbi:pathogenicity island protein [Mammaliicoccus vitulinus]|uniref:pathogenicity island protein n=1 Tax=Mammaliicoccus vitulinus TaxID=71237 RepID=UPI002DBB85EC|nr:pathogenicity island protein [Mammaliicoccus vitulinus]MEB7657622.1 pathogenicity island protein [Mammaliicoccus vitulinus]
MECTKVHKQLRQIGMLTGIEDEMYMFAISHVSTIYLELKDGKWHCWRERYQVDKPTDIKLISSDSDFNTVKREMKKYIDYCNKYWNTK